MQHKLLTYTTKNKENFTRHVKQQDEQFRQQCSNCHPLSNLQSLRSFPRADV